MNVTIPVPQSPMGTLDNQGRLMVAREWYRFFGLIQKAVGGSTDLGSDFMLESLPDQPLDVSRETFGENIAPDLSQLQQRVLDLESQISSLAAQVSVRSVGDLESLASPVSELGEIAKADPCTSALTFGGAAVSMTYAARAFRTVKIASHLYFFGGYMELSAKGSSTGAAGVSLPFTTKNVASLYVPITVNGFNLQSVAGHLQAYANPNAALLNLYYLGTGTQTGLDDTNFKDTSALAFGGLLFLL